MKQLFFQFRKDIIGLTWLSMGIFMTLAFVSYYPSDPSFNSTGRGLNVQNYCGYIGSFAADLLCQFFGLGAWALILGTILIGASFIRGKTETQYINGIWLISLILMASFLGVLYWPEFKLFEGQMSLGGVVGELVTSYMIHLFNPIGASIVLWTLSLLFVVFLTKRSVMDILHGPHRIFCCLWAHFISSLFIRKASSLGTEIKDGVQWLWEKFLTFPEKILVGSWNSMSEEKKLSSFPVASPSNPKGFATNFLIGDKKKNRELKLFHMGGGASGSEKSLKNTSLEKDTSQRNFWIKSIGRHRGQESITNWELPNLSLLEDPPIIREKVSEKEIQDKAHLLLNKLEQFSVRGKIEEILPGPAVTMFEFKPNVDVKISKITDLADDLSLALSSESVRIIAPIPGRGVVGVETSNKIRETVYLKNILLSDTFWSEQMKLPIALGSEVNGRAKVVDLRKMPHLLVAGSTGSGKSVFTVSMLSGLLFKHSPQTLRMILVDPKQVDLAAFNGIPHLLMPPIRDAKKAVSALKWAIKEMDKRYRSMSKFGSRGLESFNEKIEDLSSEEIAEHEEYNETCETTKKGQTYYYTVQPYIIVVVEEFGDLMAVDKSNVEQAVVRLAQMARACGIHLVLAMQSPRRDVVTGLIKTNIPGRISFKVASKMDSRIILDESGAERLLTRGDMLFVAPGIPKPLRHHGPWLSDSEIDGLTSYWRAQGEPKFDELAMKILNGSGGGFDLNGENTNEPWEEDAEEENEFDERYDEILAEIANLKEISASLLQRKFRLGYPRAARMIEIFEKEGVVGRAQGSKPRPVLINKL